MMRVKRLKRYWLIVAVVLSLFVVDWLYVGILRSILSYSIQSSINEVLKFILLIVGFSWSQALKTAMGSRPSFGVKIVAPLKYKEKGETKYGYRILATHDLRNPKVDLLDVFEELLVQKRGSHPEAILIRKLDPPPRPKGYESRAPDW